MYMGFSLAECGQIAVKIFDLWERAPHARAVHRVAVHLMTGEVMLRELNAMREKPRPLHTLPRLFVFTFRYAALLVVGHWLEGRHRHIKLQQSGSGAATAPGFQSYRLRKPKLLRFLEDQHFLNFATYGWSKRSPTSSLHELLEATFERGEYIARSPAQKVEMGWLAIDLFVSSFVFFALASIRLTVTSPVVELHLTSI
jgi:hypothetical protein